MTTHPFAISEHKDSRGCPDWRDESSYPGELEKWQWRWEFLRRAPEYRDAWERATVTDSETENYYPHGVRIPTDDDRDMVVMEWELYTDFQELIDPRHTPEELGFNIFSKTNLTGFLDYAMGLDDGLNEHVISTASEIRLLRRFVRKVRAIAELEKEGRLKLIAFDLARPLPDQLKEAKSTLAKAQREKVNNMKQRREKWVRHLRVVDASDQGATYSEIYEHFAEEIANGDDDVLDDWYRPEKQPGAIVADWIKKARWVSEKIVILG
jgi:hypothetical protein